MNGDDTRKRVEPSAIRQTVVVSDPGSSSPLEEDEDLAVGATLVSQFVGVKKESIPPDLDVEEIGDDHNVLYGQVIYKESLLIKCYDSYAVKEFENSLFAYQWFKNTWSVTSIEDYENPDVLPSFRQVKRDQHSEVLKLFRVFDADEEFCFTFTY